MAVSEKPTSPFTIPYDPAQYEAFRVKDGIATIYEISGGYFDAKARLTAAKDYNHPDIKRYASWKKYCEDSAHEWAAKKTYNPILNVDLKNPKEVAFWGVCSAIVSIAAIKLISGGLDVVWSLVSGGTQSGK
jgi:hypothetical protein